MEPTEIVIFVIESINVIVTAVFLILFGRRLCKITNMGVTNQYLDKHWLIRVLAAFIYILISASMLTLELIKYLNENNWAKQLLLSGSVGFCINSLILIVHIIVVSQELRKQIPFSSLHQAFLIYMALISSFRLGLIVYQFQLDMQQRFEIYLLVLSILLALASVFMVLYWVRKKKTMPTFDDLSKVDIKTITDRITNPILYDHHSLSPDKTQIEHWNLIVPNTTVETGKVRIILEMYTEDEILKSLANEETKSINDKIGPRSVNGKRDKSKQHLQIISDKLYTLAQIRKIYLQCSRFDITTKISFEGSSMADFYRQVKKFMEQLFSIKKSYVPEIWQLFAIDKTSINELNHKIQRLVRFDDELAVSSYLDHNALFLSVEVFKHFWDEDHFIFYIQSVTMDHFEKAVCYKRFTDFEQFHHKLEKIVASDNRTYKLPSLPKKHFFSMTYGDIEKAGERRKQLQSYCQQTFNDYNMMTKMPGAKDLIFGFLHLTKTFDVTPNIRKAMQFYDGLQIRKGSIYKALSDQEYVTFYEFQLFKNGIMIRNIFKRFRQFIALHQSLQDWMENCQILYKFVVLPEKVLYKSESKRHQKLIHYLENIITIKDIYKIHEVNKFFNMGHHYDSENSAFGMSIIKRQPSDCEDSLLEKKEEHKNYEISQESEKQRMSLLIEELGEQG